MRVTRHERCVWVGDANIRPVGSSGKVERLLRHGTVAVVNWGSSDRDEGIVGREVVTCQEAAERGIPPWASWVEV
jgi:hypothetical protein